MKVALISHGFAEYSIQQANGLAADCEVLLMLPRDHAVEHQAALDPRVQFIPFDNPRLRQPFHQLTTVRKLLRRIHEFRPDVVHFQQGHMWFNWALPLLRRYPRIITIHDPRSHAGDRDTRRTPQWVMDFGFRRADRVIVHGALLKRQVTELFGIAPDHVHVIPHVAIGADCGKSAPRDDGRTVLFFGRIWEYKGLRHLIAAEPLIHEALPGVRIIIAGQGDDFEQYHRLMAHPERFEVHNRYITGDERNELFERSSVVVLPYIEATQSGVIPLAYSYAKPVIATQVGALADAVDDGATGKLVPPADPFALAGAIVELLKQPQRCRTMGQAGRQKLDAEWSPRAVGAQALDVYRRAIRDRQQAGPAPAVTERVAVKANQL